MESVWFCAARFGWRDHDKGAHKDKCYAYMRQDSFKLKKAEYGVKIAGCGLCQTKVLVNLKFRRCSKDIAVRTSREDMMRIKEKGDKIG